MNLLIKKPVELIKNTSTKVKSASIAVGSSVAVLSASTFAFADGLDPAIAGGFTTAGTNIALIVAAGVGAAVGAIALSAGAKVGLKWIKGVFAKAS